LAASFRDFRAEGAFLVSASWDKGAVQDVEVLSEKGGPCRLYSPWSDAPSVTTLAGDAVEVAKPKDGIYEFATQAGQRYRIQRHSSDKRGAL
jgi:alpha-L-fucosidase 2